MNTTGQPLAALQRDIGAMAGLLRVMGNPQRLSILCLLAERECPVAEIGAALGISQPGLSQHLAQLRDAGFVKTRREARHIHYALADARIRRLLEALDANTDAPRAALAPTATRRPIGEAAQFARVQTRPRR